ncbi:hypothetical protein HDV05_004783 [Chytridiales sp. JEL 0842]|nr:hypothetical protein HDV05_004783 [Chytridiales sp. JEL 0842]
MRLLNSYIPFTEWITHYRVSFLVPDLLGGLTVSALVIPQAMAYSVMAGLPPVHGLYTSIFPTAVYFLLGVSPFQNIGPFAVVSLMVAQAGSIGSSWVESQIQQQQQPQPGIQTAPPIFNATPATLLSTSYQPYFPHLSLPSSLSATSSFEQQQIRTRYTLIVVFLTFLVGCFQALLYLTRISTLLSSLLPDALIKGFMTAAGITIIVAQLKYLVGVSVPTYSDMFGVFKTIGALVGNMGKVKWVAVGMSVGGVICLMAIRFLEGWVKTYVGAALERRRERLKRAAEGEGVSQEGDLEGGRDAECATANSSPATLSPPNQDANPSPPPTQTPKKPAAAAAITDVLLTVILALVITFAFQLNSKTGLQIIGQIPTGFPSPMEPWRIWYTLQSFGVSGWGLVGVLMPSVALVSLVGGVMTLAITRTFGGWEGMLHGEEETVDLGDCSKKDGAPAEVSEETQEEEAPRSSIDTHPSTSSHLSSSSASSSSSSSTHNNTTPTPPDSTSQEILALSLSSLVAAVFTAYVPSGSLSRSAVLATQTPTKSHMASLVSIIIVSAVVGFIGGWFENVPLCILAVVIILALVGGVERGLREGVRGVRESVSSWKCLRARRLGENGKKEEEGDDGEGVVVVERLEDTASPCIQQPAQEGEDYIESSIGIGAWDSEVSLVPSNSTSNPLNPPTCTHGPAECPPSSPRRNPTKGTGLYIIGAFADFVMAFQASLLWWFTFLGVLVLDSGTGILIGIGLAGLCKVCEYLRGRSGRRGVGGAGR